MRGSYAVRTAARYVRGGPDERARMHRNAFFGLARRYTDVIRTPEGLFVSTHDQVVARSAFVEGGFDAPQMDRILATLDVPLAGRTILDIGANIGTSTVDFIRRGAGQVIAFEPDPGNFDLLRHNTLGMPVEAHQLALSSEPGELEFARNPSNFGDHRVIRSDAERAQAAEIVKVPARTLDSFALDLSAVALVWMDVQGHEARVLAGASSCSPPRSRSSRSSGLRCSTRPATWSGSRT